MLTWWYCYWWYWYCYGGDAVLVLVVVLLIAEVCGRLMCWQIDNGGEMVVMS